MKHERPLKMDDLIQQEPTELQKKAFEKAVRQSAEVTLNHWKVELKKVDDPKEYIQDLIRELDDRLNESKESKRLKQGIQKGEYRYTGFSESFCKKILSQKEPQIWYVYFVKTENGKVVAREENRSFSLAVDYRLKKELESFDVKNSSVNETGSNADKLSKAADWMNPLMDKITSFDLPKHKDVMNVFEKEYPGFGLKFDLKSLKTPYFAKGGKFKKKSIALALIYIFEQQYPGEKIKDYTAITKRYKHLDW